MTQNKIISMAKEAGLLPVLLNVRLGEDGVLATDCIEAFAKLVASAAIEKEREACAEMFEDMSDEQWSCLTQSEGADAIRARGETHEHD